MPRKVSEIAREAKANMIALRFETPVKAPQFFAYAWPYLTAMLSIDDINGMYGADSAKSVVRYFLANTSTWRGETARRLKLELKKLLGD